MTKQPITAVRFVYEERNYYEHIVRNESVLRQIQLYIQQNPFRWDEDRDNPNNLRNLKPPQTIDDYLEDIFALEY